MTFNPLIKFTPVRTLDLCGNRVRRIQQRVIHSVSGIVATELVLLAVRISCASMDELSWRYNEVGNNDLCHDTFS